MLTQDLNTTNNLPLEMYCLRLFVFLSKDDCSYVWYGCYQFQPSKSTAKGLKLEEFALISLVMQLSKSYITLFKNLFLPRTQLIVTHGCISPSVRSYGGTSLSVITF